ncbi:gas vesicle protein GvpO [Microlunatus soli]|nr:gas vesicle protein GvpO [Microlunatus soli]
MAENQEEHEKSRQKGRSQPTTSAVSAATTAREQLTALLDRDIEQVVGIERNDDGWTVQIEVVETHRIPNSTDILGLYDVQVDRQGDLTGYRRGRRYSRGHGDDRAS